MRTCIVVFVLEHSKQPVDALPLGGENATNSNFLQTIRNVLASVASTLPPTLDVDIATVADPTFAAARGMAVYARRRQEAPGPCVESLICDKKGRRSELGGANGMRNFDDPQYQRLNDRKSSDEVGWR